MYIKEVNEISLKAKEILKIKDKVVIVIDGMTGSGKTTLAGELKAALNANIFHADDFFLPPELRTEKRLSEPGGNIHYERMKVEIIDKLTSNDKKPITYTPYNCHKKCNNEPITQEYNPISIVEGSYSLNNYFGKYYDIAVFLSLDKDRQIERIKHRCPERLNDFINKWIPFETKYHNELKIKEKADLIYYY